MQKLQAEMTALFKKLYADEPKILVFGEGDPKARLVLIGEAPGEQETIAGRPFVGKAGKNLDEFLARSGLKREELYITNTVKFRPTRRSSAGNWVNRPPTQEEVHLFLPWLKKEIDMVNPECVVTLGNVPLRALTDRKTVIGDVHGTFLERDGRRIFPMYHPASVIYNPSLKEVYRADVLKLGEWLRENKK